MTTMMLSALAHLEAHARRRGWSVRLGLDANGASAPKDRQSRIAWLGVYNKRGREGEEIEAVFVPAKKETSLDDAASLLLELVQRLPAED